VSLDPSDEKQGAAMFPARSDRIQVRLFGGVSRTQKDGFLSGRKGEKVGLPCWYRLTCPRHKKSSIFGRVALYFNPY
jgi:hypothetical protein